MVNRWGVWSGGSVKEGRGCDLETEPIKKGKRG